MSQPVIGNFSIPLGDLIKETSREVERRVKKLSDLYYATQEIQTSIIFYISLIHIMPCVFYLSSYTRFISFIVFIITLSIEIDDQKSKETKRKTPRIPEFPVEEGTPLKKQLF